MGSMVDKPVTLSGNCPTDNANGLPCRGQDRKVSWGLSSKRTYLGFTGSLVGCRLDPPCRGQQIKHSQTPVRGQRDRAQDHHPMMQTTPTDSKYHDKSGSDSGHQSATILMRYLLRLRRCVGGFYTPKHIRTQDSSVSAFFTLWLMGVVCNARKKIRLKKKGISPMPRVSPPAVTPQLSRQPSGWEM